MKTPLSILAALLLAGTAYAEEPEPDIWTKPSNGSTPAPASQPKRGRSIAVFDPVGVGVDPMACTTVGDLMRSELTKLGNSVTPRSTMPKETCADEACASEKSRDLMVNEAVVTRISRLDQKVLIMATVVDVGTGRAVFADRMTAASLDDFDVLAVRVARGIDRRVPFAETLTADAVSEYESRDQKRQRALYTTGLRIGGLFPVGGSYVGSRDLYLGEVVSLYEVRDYMIEAALGFRGNTNDPARSVGEWYVDLGGYYHLSNNDISPFIGAGMGLHTVAATWDEYDKIAPEPQRVTTQATGPAAWIGGGATLLRASDIHLIATVKYTAVFVNLDGQPAHGAMLGLAATYTRKSGGMGCCLW